MGSMKLADSRLLQPGRVVGSTDGSAWLVLSSIRTGSGLQFRLADLAGRPAPTPHDFDPVHPKFAHLAAMLRRLAFNPDFDEYVKAYIRRAGLPLDPSMNWAKYLQTSLGPQLGTFDPEITDEAIHHIIFKVLGERHFLEPGSDYAFDKVIQRFKPEVQALPLEKQVTEVLKKMFTWRGQEARRYVKEVLMNQDISEDVTEQSFVPMERPEEEGGGSVLDTPEHATGMRQFEEAETNVDMGDYLGRKQDIILGRFSSGFQQWMIKKYPGGHPKKNEKGEATIGAPIVRQYMRLLTLLHHETRTSGKFPKLEEIERDWRRYQGAFVESSRNRLDHEGFLKIFKHLPILIEAYVRTHFHGQEGTLPTIVRVLNKFGQEKRRKQIEESDRDRAERQKVEEQDVAENPLAPAGDILPTEEAAVRDLPPPSKLSAQNKQFVAPRCPCGETRELQTCKGCQGVFCMLCIRDHHANQPGHDRVV